MEFELKFNGINVYDLDGLVKQANALIKEKRALCMLGADIPVTPVPMQMDRVCGFIESVELRDNKITVGLKFINTPMGKIAEELHNSNVQMEVRPIGIGTVIDRVIQDDYKLIGFYIENEVLR